MATVEIDGILHYHEVHGSGVPVLLLHGGFCSLEILRPQIDSLSTRCRVHVPERPGHGRTADTDGPITYPQSVADTLAYMDAVGLEAAHVVGFSDGAIIGLLLALDHPDRVRSLVAISANLNPSGFIGNEESSNSVTDAQDDQDDQNAQDDGLTIYRQHYRDLSPDGYDHIEVVLDKLQHLWAHEPDIDPSTLARIRVPTLVMAGDRDVIHPDHTRLIASSIPGSQLCIVPGAGHDLMETRPAVVNLVLELFISDMSDR